MQFAETGNLMGSPYKWKQHGESGAWVSEIFPETAKMVDELCNFEKGCYLGQEVINRMERIAKGRTTRKLGRIRAAGAVDLSGGELLGEGGKKLGSIGSSCTHQGHSFGMGMLRNAAWDHALTWVRDELTVSVEIWPLTGE